MTTRKRRTEVASLTAAPVAPEAEAAPAAVTRKTPTGPVVRVRFLKNDAPWRKGEVIEFAAPAAAKLVRHHVAEYAED
jgi:hypothetical protein